MELICASRPMTSTSLVHPVSAAATGTQDPNLRNVLGFPLFLEELNARFTPTFRLSSHLCMTIPPELRDQCCPRMGDTSERQDESILVNLCWSRPTALHEECSDSNAT